MTLDDFYKKLALGELSNLALADGGVIADNKKETLLLHANDGLVKLYTRLPIKTESLFLMQVGYLTRYHLSSKYALSNYAADSDHSFYIQDTTEEPFKDDIAKVLTVWNGQGCELPLNRRDRLDSVFTLQPTLLQVPYPQDGQPLSVQYQALHPVLTMDVGGPDIELPDFLMEALTSFVAGKVFSNMTTQEATAKGAEYLNRFETICVEVQDQDLVTLGTSTSNIRFEQNGWR